MLSCVDVQDAFHSINLVPSLKNHPHFRNPDFRYEVLPIGLSISPQKGWSMYKQMYSAITAAKNILLLQFFQSIYTSYLHIYHIYTLDSTSLHIGETSYI